LVVRLEAPADVKFRDSNDRFLKNRLKDRFHNKLLV
jgi:hypothetical protein